MTFAAWVTETVGSPDVAMAGELWAALTFGSLTGVANTPDGAAEGGVDSVLLGDGRSAVASFGGTSAADGGTEPTDAVAEALAVADGEDDGACVARLGVVAVDVTVGDSEFGATARGACDSTFVTVGAEVAVGDAGATTAVVVAVTGAGATGSIACCVCCCVCGGDSTGAAGAMAGAFGGACAAGASVSSATGALGSGAAVVVMTGSVSGLANAGATPPVSAVSEITTPVARTATTPRFEQISSGAPICASTPQLTEHGGLLHHCCHAQPSPPTLGPVQQLPRLC
jgi:hypothetical protein